MHATIMDSFPIPCKSFYQYDEKMSIHAVIRSHRVKLKLTEQQLAERCGVTRPAVQQWEKENGTAPKRAIQPLVAKSLGITLSKLLETGAQHDAQNNDETTLPGAIATLAAVLQDIDSTARDRAGVLLQNMASEPDGPWSAWLIELLKKHKGTKNPALQKLTLDDLPYAEPHPIPPGTFNLGGFDTTTTPPGNQKNVRHIPEKAKKQRNR